MPVRKALFFDVDGTLVDSAAAHILFWRDVDKELKLELDIPNILDAEACKKILGVPAEVFLRKNGVSEEQIKHAIRLYEERFSQDDRYISPLFSGVSEMLEKLKECNHILGIVTANGEANAKRALDKHWQLFEHRFCLGDSKKDYDRNKVGVLSSISKKLKRDGINEFRYIGDRIVDYEAARDAGVRFIGVGYGWGKFSQIEEMFLVRKSVTGLENILVCEPGNTSI